MPPLISGVGEKSSERRGARLRRACFQAFIALQKTCSTIGVRIVISELCVVDGPELSGHGISIERDFDRGIDRRNDSGGSVPFARKRCHRHGSGIPRISGCLDNLRFAAAIRR